MAAAFAQHVGAEVAVISAGEEWRRDRVLVPELRARPLEKVEGFVRAPVARRGAGAHADGEERGEVPLDVRRAGALESRGGRSRAIAVPKPCAQQTDQIGAQYRMESVVDGEHLVPVWRDRRRVPALEL